MYISQQVSGGVIQKETLAAPPLRETLDMLHRHYSPTEILDCMTRIYEERATEDIRGTDVAVYQVMGTLVGNVVRTINHIIEVFVF